MADERMAQNLRGDELKRALLAIRDLRRQVSDLQNRAREPIAIIGMSCRLPGGADTPERYWELLRDGVDATSEVPPDRWDIDAHYDPDPDAAGRMYTRRGGFLAAPVDQFDAAFFNISPREAAAMDPVQRLLLELSWESLERAGVAPHALVGSDTGVFVGTSGSDYDTLQHQNSTLSDIHTYRGTGTAACVAGGRISYVLGLHGPNMAVDTACSSSLVAVALAVDNLRAGKCSLALAGGAHLMLAPESSVYLSRMRALSPDGRCRTFDDAADGYARGEGGCMFVLKRVADANRDGDPILAVIRGAAVNHDGHSSGLTVPNPSAQRAVIGAALRDAGLAPADVDYVEAHGTGTPLGDPIEVRAMAEVLGRDRPAERPLLVGSVKTNFGHLEAAAGAAGLMKLVLSLQHGQLPPHLNVTQPTRHVDWDSVSVRINRVLTPWSDTQSHERRAGVSAFGFSGTNAHVIVEAAPKTAAHERSLRPAELVVISGRSPGAVRDSARRYAARVRSADAAEFADIALTSLVGRSPMPFRAVAVAQGAEDMAAALDDLAEAGDAAMSHVNGPPIGQLAFLFTGQGSQYPGMGRELFDASTVARSALERCDEILRPHLDRRLLDLLLDEPDADVIRQTKYAQPVLFAIEYALAALWQSRGVEPAFVAGHSLGEYVAATVAGVMTLEDALPLVALRGRLMQELPAGGRMSAVLAPEAQVAAAIAQVEGVSIAAVNAPENTVISGSAERVAEALEVLARDGVEHRDLHVSHAFHSVLMEPMLDAFETAVASVNLRAPQIPIISNITGDVLADTDAVDPRRWRRHIRETVRFAPSLRRLQELGVRTFVEVGPHPALSALGTATLADASLHWLSSMRRGRSAWQQVLETTGALWSAGYELDISAIARDHGGRRVAAPTYAFQRERFWFTDGKAARPARTRQQPVGVVHPLLGVPVRSPAIDGWVFEVELSATQPPYLADHRVGDNAVVPAAAFAEMMLAAARHGPEWENASLGDLVLERPLILDGEAPTTCQVIIRAPTSGSAHVRIVAAASQESEWLTTATAVLHAHTQHEVSAPSLEALRAECAAQVDVAGLYAAIERRGIKYGSAFHTLRSAWTDGAGAIGRVELAADVDAAGYTVHPALLDGALHLLGSMVGNAEPDAMFLPSGVDALWIDEPVGAACWVYARTRTTDHTPDQVTADLTLFDDSGRAIAAVEGFRSRRVRGAVAQGADARLLYHVEWDELDGVSTDATVDGQWLLIDDGAGRSDALAQALTRMGATCVSVSASAAADATRQNAANLRGIVYMHTADGCTRDGAATLNAVVDACSAFIEPAAAAGVSLRIVTRDAAGPFPGRGNSWMTGASLWGMLPALRAEHPELDPRIIDVDADAVDADALAHAITNGFDEDRIALRDGRMLAPRLVRGMPADGGRTPGAIEHENYRMMPERRGTLESIHYEAAPRTDPGPGEVEVRVRVTGLNFRDVLNVLGMYPGDPGTPGVEFAGIVTRTGAGVSHPAAGDAVIGIGTGLFTAYATVNANTVVAKPANLTFEQAATIPLAFMSAEWGLMHAGSLRAGERVLIHAATGGVGQAAVQIAQAAGAEVFATAGSDEKRALLREQGVQHVFDSRSDSFAAGIRTATGGEGVDVVLNSLTDELLQRSLELLRPGGRFVELGAREVLDPADVARTHPGIRYEAFQLGALPLTDDEFAEMFADVVRRFETGALQPLRVRSFPADRITEAFRYMAQARHIGKVVIAAAQVSVPIVRGDGAYLVTGASGGIGRALVEWLADQGAGAIVLNSRSAPDAAMNAWLDQLRARGTNAVWIGGDVADPGAVDAMIAHTSRTGMPLRGVFHAAGVVDDVLMRSYDRGRIARVLAPKVRGAINLHEATRALDLDHFVLFSSTAALLAGAGQAVYGAGNAFLGALAEMRRAAGMPALCIDWGAWAGDGMAGRLSARERAALERNGLAFLDPHAALSMLGRLMSYGPSRIVAADIRWDRLRTATGARPLPLLRQLLDSPETNPEASGGPAALLDQATLAELDGEERAERIDGYVVHAMAAVLGLRPDRLGGDTAVGSLGFDSLMAMELRNRIETDLGIIVPVAALLQAETPAAIADAIAGRTGLAESAPEVLETFEF